MTGIAAFAAVAAPLLALYIAAEIAAARRKARRAKEADLRKFAESVAAKRAAELRAKHEAERRLIARTQGEELKKLRRMADRTMLKGKALTPDQFARTFAPATPADHSA